MTEQTKAPSSADAEDNEWWLQHTTADAAKALLNDYQAGLPIKVSEGWGVRLASAYLSELSRRERMEEALRQLRNEACAVLGFEHALRGVIGNTNIAVLKLRVEQADAALTGDKR